MLNQKEVMYAGIGMSLFDKHVLHAFYSLCTGSVMEYM